MKKSKKVASKRYATPPMQTPNKGMSVFAVGSIVFGAIFLFALGLTTYGNLTGYAVTSASGGGASVSIGNGTNTTCYDSDGNLPWPQQYFVKGYCIDSTHPAANPMYDICGGNTTCNEYYCNYQNRCTNISMNCANLNESTGQCSNGACVKKPSSLTGLSGGGGAAIAENGTNGTNGTQPVYNCTDSDGGIMPYIKGIVTYGGLSYTDFCWNNGTNSTNSSVLAEFYCWSNYPSRTLIYCPGRCYNGICLNATSLTDTSIGAGIDGINPGKSCPNLGYFTAPPQNCTSDRICEQACDSTCRGRGGG